MSRISILWTIDIVWAYPAIIITDVWQWTPFMFIILLAALSNVDREQLDAAAIDGSSGLRTFREVDVAGDPAGDDDRAADPRARPRSACSNSVWQLTRGGPGSATETISIYAYIRGFQEFDTSYIAAVIVVLAILFSVGLVFALKRMAIAR